MTQFSSGLPFNSDPTPYRYAVTTAAGVVEVRSATDPVGNREHRPRRQFDRQPNNPANTVLAHLREHCRDRGDKVRAWQVAKYLESVDVEALGAPPEHVAHAREVLTRLVSAGHTGPVLDLRQTNSRPAPPPVISTPSLQVIRDESTPFATAYITMLGVFASAGAAFALLLRIVPW